MRSSKWLVCVAAVALALGVAACGDDDEGNGDQGGGASTSTTAAFQAPEPPSTEPFDTIMVDEPLPEAPPRGKEVVFLQCELPVCQIYADSVREATTALGWNQRTITFRLAQADGALRQAVARNPDYIMMTGGTPSAQLRTGLPAAHRAGIPVTSYGVPEASDPENGFAIIPYNSADPYTHAIASWAANDAKGRANILYVNSSAIPVFGATNETTRQLLEEQCPECTIELLDITLEELASGGVPAKVIGALQSNPNIDYVMLQWSDLFPGLVPALKAAGLADRVKVVGGAINGLTLKAILDGEAAAWSVVDIGSQAWLAVDGLARLSVGEELTPEYLETIENNPAWVLADQETARQLQAEGTDADPWPGPTGWQDQYKELWQVASS